MCPSEVKTVTKELSAARKLAVVYKTMQYDIAVGHWKCACYDMFTANSANSDLPQAEGFAHES